MNNFISKILTSPSGQVSRKSACLQANFTHQGRQAECQNIDWLWALTSVCFCIKLRGALRAINKAFSKLKTRITRDTNLSFHRLIKSIFVSSINTNIEALNGT